MEEKSCEGGAHQVMENSGEASANSDDVWHYPVMGVDKK